MSQIVSNNTSELPKEKALPEVEKNEIIHYNHVILRILQSDYVTHDVKRFVLEKPPGYYFIPGQSVNISINLPEWNKVQRPFTFTNLPEDNYLEFFIKIYRNHDGVTEKLESLHIGDELILHDIFGEIKYNESGVFIAAGSGITPFLSIFKNLVRQNNIKNNILIYSNKTSEDLIMEDYLQAILQQNFIKVFTRENVIGFIEKRIDRNFIIDHINNFKQQFYICGPENFVTSIKEILLSLGAESNQIIFED